ncbi:MAG TPA: hypothetical protein VKH41_04285 [Myxococcota bacterium]|nr:hypothetical protein [Myxococcota bacterium]
MTLVHRCAIAILFAFACGLSPAAGARDLFILRADGVTDSGHDVQGLVDDLLSHDGPFRALGLQPNYSATLDYLGIANAVTMQASAFGTQVVVAIPRTGFAKTFTGATPNDVQNQVENFFEGSGAHELAKFLEKTNAHTKLAMLDGNPASTTAMFARSAYERFGIGPLRTREGYRDEHVADVGHFDLGVQFRGGVVDTSHFDSLYTTSGAVTLGGDLESGVGLYVSMLGQYRNYDGADIYDAGLELGLPITLVPLRGGVLRWAVTPVVQAGGGASSDLFAGGFLVGGGAVNSFGWNLGPLELTVADEFVYYGGVPLGEIGGVRIETELDRWITRNGIKMALYPPGHEWLCIEGGAAFMHFLGGGAKEGSAASPFIGVAVKAFDLLRVRVGWETDFGEHDYAVHTGRVDLGFQF